MTLDRAVMAFAGFIVLVSLALAYMFSPYWLLLTTSPASISFRRRSPASVRPRSRSSELGVGPGTAFK